MITVFSTARQLSVLNALFKGQKYNQEYFVQNIFPSLLNVKKLFHARKPQSIFLCIWTTRCATMGINLSMNYVAWRFSKLLIHPTRQTSLRPIFRFSEISKENWKIVICKARPEEILTAFQELWDNITFEEFQMAFKSWRDQLRWIIEHDEDHFRKWQISNSAISWISKNRGTFSLLFGQSVSPESPISS
jgi:hypothetical protein